MKFKIACPNCAHSLTLSDPKVGKYKPTCSKCTTPFAIVVECGQPPKIRVGKLSAKSTEDQSTTKVEPKSSDAKPVTTADLQATLPPDSPTRPEASDKTMAWEGDVMSAADTNTVVVPANKSHIEDSYVDAPKTTGFDATLVGEPNTKPLEVEATIGFTKAPEQSVYKSQAANTES